MKTYLITKVMPTYAYAKIEAESEDQAKAVALADDADIIWDYDTDYDSERIVTIKEYEEWNGIMPLSMVTEPYGFRLEFQQDEKD